MYVLARKYRHMYVHCTLTADGWCLSQCSRTCWAKYVRMYKRAAYVHVYILSHIYVHMYVLDAKYVHMHVHGAW